MCHKYKNSEDLNKLIDILISEGSAGEMLNLLADRLQTEQLNQTNYLLFLGLNKELTSILKIEISKIVNEFTDSFTMYPAMGFYKDEREHTVIIQIAAASNFVAYNCAEALRNYYKQEGIGVLIKPEGTYRRVMLLKNT